MLQTLSAPPPSGSLQESALILLMMMLESIEHARFRALSQLLLDKDKGIEAFDEYMKVAFPYLAAAKRRDREVFVKELKRWVTENKAGIRVTPIVQPKATSRLKTRLNQPAPIAATPRMREQAQLMTKKLGSIIPK